MGRSPCCDSDANVKKGPWTVEEDKMLMDYIEQHDAGNWRHLPKKAGLNRCGKSCRLRWSNYLRPDIKRGAFSEEEERHIIHLHSILGNKWSTIANQLPGRTDNEIKNFWNTHIRKKLLMMGIDPVTHRPRTDLNLLANLPSLITAAANYSNVANDPLMNALRLPNLQLLQNLIQTLAHGSSSNIGLQNLNQPSLGFSNLSVAQSLNFNLQSLLGSSNLSMIGSEMAAPTNYGYRHSKELGTEGSCSGGGSGSASFMSTPTTTSTHSLVSASPENHTVDQAPKLVNSSDISSCPALFEQWSGLTLDDLDTDLGWKDILEEIPWSNPLEHDWN